MSARERILARVRAALEKRPRAPHPGSFKGARTGEPPSDPVDGFVAAFTRSGGEVARVPDEAAASAWLATFASGFRSVAVGATVPPSLVPALANAPPDAAALGLSVAVAAVAETGTLVLDARDGRLTQLLPSTHVVFLRGAAVHATLAGMLAALRPDLPSALGLHSGPSKSADIGQILVRGVHGPGRVVALVVEASANPPASP